MCERMQQAGLGAFLERNELARGRNFYLARASDGGGQALKLGREEFLRAALAVVRLREQEVAALAVVEVGFDVEVMAEKVEGVAEVWRVLATEFKGGQ